jgi:formylmethanofuran dehydrogenase subunit D
MFFKPNFKYNPRIFIDKGWKIMVTQKLPVKLITGRSLEQGVNNQRGKGSKEYFETVTTIFMDQRDMEKLGITEGTHVTVTSSVGSVVLKATKYPRGSMAGIAYLPYGPWANVINCDDTTTTGMPTCKGYNVEIEATPDKPILNLMQLFELEFGKKGVECHQ